MSAYLPARRMLRLGDTKQMPRRFAAAALSPRSHPAIVAIGRHPRRLDALRRAVQAQLDRDGVRAREVRVVRVDEEPRGLCLAAAGPAHSGGRSGGGQGYAVVVICAVRRAACVSVGQREGEVRGRTFCGLGCGCCVGTRSTR